MPHLKPDPLESLARTFRSMGHPSRLRILQALLHGPLSVGQIAARSGLSQPNTSAHLAALRASGVVRAQPRGRHVLYSLAEPRLARLLEAATSEGPLGPALQADLIDAFRHAAQRSALGETLALAAYHPPHIVILDQALSPQRLHTAFRLGELLAPETCAAGPVLQAPPPRAVQRDGYHLQRARGALEVALPICADGRHPTAALILSAPPSRMSAQAARHALPTLRQMAARISYALGAQCYAPYQPAVGQAVDPVNPLAPDEIQALLQAPWAANLACVRPDGGPHVVPVWHAWDGQSFTVAAWEGSRWADYLLANPRVSLTIDEPWPPLRRVIARGDARPLHQAPGPDGAPAVLEALAQRYLGRSTPAEMAARPWRAFRIHVRSLRGWRGLPIQQP